MTLRCVLIAALAVSAAAAAVRQAPSTSSIAVTTTNANVTTAPQWTTSSPDWTTSPPDATTSPPDVTTSPPESTTTIATPEPSTTPLESTSASHSTTAYLEPTTPSPTTPVSTTMQPTMTTKSPPAPCSSDRYHLFGKCGGAEHGYLRCGKGDWCSSDGYCGNSKEFRTDARCEAETRGDPAENEMKFGFSPDDNPVDYLPQDDTEGEKYDKGKTLKNCHVQKFHRWGKCGTKAHGNFRCRYGEWCDQWGYCNKFTGAAVNATCPREPRHNPKKITYHPTPDDNPDYVEPVATTAAKKSVQTTTAAFIPIHGGSHW